MLNSHGSMKMEMEMLVLLVKNRHHHDLSISYLIISFDIQQVRVKVIELSFTLFMYLDDLSRLKLSLTLLDMNFFSKKFSRSLLCLRMGDIDR